MRVVILRVQPIKFKESLKEFKHDFRLDGIRNYMASDVEIRYKLLYPNHCIPTEENVVKWFKEQRDYYFKAKNKRLRKDARSFWMGLISFSPPLRREELSPKWEKAS